MSCPNCTTMVPSPRWRRCTAPPASTGWWCRRTSRSRAPGSPASHELDEQWTKVAGRSRASSRRAGALDGAGRAGRGLGPKPIAGNVIPLAGSVKEAGYTSEEWKMVRETPQDPPRRPRSGAPSPACGCPCTSATRCRSTCSSTAPMTQGRGGRAARATRRACSSSTTATAHPTPLEAAGHRPGARRPAARGPVAGRTRSTSGSPATTCARARRSTASRSPSCSSSA